MKKKRVVPVSSGWVALLYEFTVIYSVWLVQLISTFRSIERTYILALILLLLRLCIENRRKWSIFLVASHWYISSCSSRLNYIVSDSLYSTQRDWVDDFAELLSGWVSNCHQFDLCLCFCWHNNLMAARERIIFGNETQPLLTTQ